MKKILEVKNLSFDYENFNLKNINLTIEKGKFIGIIGPNGSGKSTTLKLVTKLLKPKSGKILLFGKNLENCTRTYIASKISFVRQEFNPVFEFKVKDIIELGALHRKKSFFTSIENQQKIKNCLDMVELSGYEDRYFSTLSGGEQRRVLIARSLYQETPIIIVDELAAHLDISHAVQIVEILKKLTKKGKSILSAFHNINIASKYCDYIYALKDGQILFEGAPKDVITIENIKKLYNKDFHIINHPKYNYPIVTV
ncbi:ABC transporter [Thermosipho melanesiensis]|uniref:ABC transporter related n=2 Tax=Thermosipho melanesiensis TaxID=46541 RepID=A6LMK8_THEM4|nr:ABC transporter ATP-binding protein [Thermosipho melanesiensis]ABR31159.1 ABC transporter related [Thermosipho melanesiensis BI429]APT74249.1 ABC transporter [Thermosipho melanesiensis]OOC36188.1 ABC transporter [Thermosipho melanesiensis]OOC37006.1 ABC transporter [Thermosipho melanesiensis]OOC37758.1 ABC transporter [Thermosipho melanesiensis]